jgi:hypothetical protein
MVLLEQNPGSSLPDPAQAAPTKSLWIGLDWIDTTFLKRQLGLDFHYSLELIFGSLPQTRRGLFRAAGYL